MRSITFLLAAAVAVGAAACADAPTASTASGTEAALSSSNQAPVAVITRTGTQLFPGGRRHFLTAASSYDPDGWLVDYSWVTNCIYNPTVYGSVTYTLEVNSGDTCDVTLGVKDNDGAWSFTQKQYN